MLQIKNISKQYMTGELVQNALKDVSLNFRDNEFVSILGPSGSGKTTLLNIIGGLDRYDKGDLIINNVSTKDYKDRDWDSYRNHTVGFVFQSYNLIPHQTVLSNVELALTISGISKAERRERALEALDAVGLKDQAHKKPNQMSGGQMQRVAIARALVNNPDILLADEPTGALDTETSVQVMELLKKVADDRLVIMVTHNPELAQEYSTRIVKLKDGEITGDSMPFDPDQNDLPEAQHRNLGKAFMSLGTAFSLSLNNLLTKKGRTILTSFAGSIGIIGIALILSLSNGFQNYIDKIQNDTLSSYPLTITSETADMTSALLSMTASSEEEVEKGKVKEQQYISTMFSEIGQNDLKSLKAYIERNAKEVSSMTSLVRYQYSVSPVIYTTNCNNEITQLNPSSTMSALTSGTPMSGMASMPGTSVFNELIDDRSALNEQYRMLEGRWPKAYDEVIIMLPDENSISDLLLYSLGLRDNKELQEAVAKIMAGESVEAKSEPLTMTYEELMSIPLKLVEKSDTYKYNSQYGVYEDMTEDAAYMKSVYESSTELKIVGVVCPKKDNSMISLGVGYTKELTEHVIKTASESEIVKKQLANKDVDVFSGKAFDEENESSGIDFSDMISVDTQMLSSAFGMKVSETDISKMTQGYMTDISAAITTDTKAAKDDFTNVLATLATNMFKDYLDKNGTAGMATIRGEDAQNIVSSYMSSQLAASLLSELESKYVVPKDTFETLYSQLLIGMVQGYSATGMPIAEATIEPFVSAFIQSDAVKTAADKMAAGMTEAVMQKTILTKVGELSGELAKTMASGFNVDQSKIAGAFKFNLNEEELSRLMSAMSANSEEKTAASNLISLGYQNLDEPTAIAFYFENFDSKELFTAYLEDYNKKMEKENSDKVIQWTDLTGILMSSVKTIVDSVTYVLIAFVSISLVVSSVMIGIITYISVFERTKEIGVLRAIGASKKNISSIFNAETFIVGLCAGLMGVGVTCLLIPPINHLIHSVTGNGDVNAVLPIAAAVILVTLSIILTLIGGLIPSRQAAKKDPVLALRSE